MLNKNNKDYLEKIKAAEGLLLTPTTTLDKFYQIKTLIRGINPKVDQTLEKIGQTIDKLQKLQKGELIELTAESLPERSEEEKKRKKAILLLIKYWKELQAEVKRLKAEFQQNQSNSSQKGRLNSFSKILLSAKGPLGIITVVSLIIVGVMLTRQNSADKEIRITKQDDVTNTPVPVFSGIQGIVYQGQKIALSEFIIGTGTDCDSPHYHAPGESTVSSIDGEKIQDPGGCGFGKVKEVPVINIQ